MFFREQAAKHFAAGIDAAAKNRTVWPRKINMLENALLVRLLRREMYRFDAGFGDAHHFAGLDFAHITRVEKIERTGFACYDPHFALGRGELAQVQRTEAARVAHFVKFVWR